MSRWEVRDVVQPLNTDTISRSGRIASRTPDLPPGLAELGRQLPRPREMMLHRGGVEPGIDAAEKYREVGRDDVGNLLPVRGQQLLFGRFPDWRVRRTHRLNAFQSPDGPMARSLDGPTARSIFI